MEIHTLFLQLTVILLSARVMAEVAARLGAPPVIGELAAGVVLGPSLLGWVAPEPALRLLAEIGIILLLFEVGLETDAAGLVRTGRASLQVALYGLVLPFGFGFFLARGAFGLDLLPALFVGGTLTATSIGVTVRILGDLGRQQSREGRVVLGAAVLDDVMGVVLLAVLYEFSLGGGVSLANAGKVILFIGLFFLLATPAAKGISAVIDRFDAASPIPGLIPTTIVSLVLLFAWLAHVVGAPELLGGFAAGLALSRRFFLPFGLAIRTRPEFAERIEHQMKPVIHLFTPIFFVMVGLSLNLRVVDWGSPAIWLLSGSLFVVAVAGKMIGALLIRETPVTRLLIGLAMVPRGEVGLIFAELGRTAAILADDTYAALVLVIALTTVAPPFAMKWVYRRGAGPD
jgi:Na+:H+ antiporter